MFDSNGEVKFAGEKCSGSATPTLQHCLIFLLENEDWSKSFAKVEVVDKFLLTTSSVRGKAGYIDTSRLKCRLFQAQDAKS